MVLENDLIYAGWEIVSWFSIHTNYLLSLRLKRMTKKDRRTDGHN